MFCLGGGGGAVCVGHPLDAEEEARLLTGLQHIISRTRTRDKTAATVSPGLFVIVVTTMRGVRNARMPCAERARGKQDKTDRRTDRQNGNTSCTVQERKPIEMVMDTVHARRSPADGWWPLIDR